MNLDSILQGFEASLRSTSTVDFDHYAVEVSHGRTVEALAVEIADSLPMNLTEDEVFVVRAASILHDCGRMLLTPARMTDDPQHVLLGREAAWHVLRNTATLTDYPSVIDQELGIVEHHDDTTLSYPYAKNSGRPFGGLTYAYGPPNNILLSIVRAADALVSVEPQAIDVHIDSCVEEGTPFCAPTSTPLATWQWGESIAGNLRLLAKRGVVDSCSSQTLRRALQAYEAMESRIEAFCSVAGIAY